MFFRDRDWARISLRRSSLQTILDAIKQRLTDTRSQRTKNREKTEKTQTNTQQPKQTHSSRSGTGENTSNTTTLIEADPAPTNNWTWGRPSTNQQLNLQKKLHRQRCEDPQPNQGGKASTRPINNGGKASARRELQPTTTAAKHPPEQYGSKATANRRPTRPGRCRGTKQRQAQKRILPRRAIDSHRQEHPRQRLQRGSDAKGAVVVRPTWSRFSPGKLTEEEGIGERVTPSTR